ncbi:hypothetical protein DAPPUDRAFT_337453 [Daphnia pulex]|uniref:Uncharacterized protein n=1 Tax=Daphnia pulex TaxID=6669 RepID=E9I1N4_DAPPU|nr:hypothetical protein DAPPUDRAFT_337453 [Daphnia pulex]|eukprot:EFX62097.1 hypothetical protein DAPPUDRAFT_337453 [Daphnia pulex]
MCKIFYKFMNEINHEKKVVWSCGRVPDIQASDDQASDVQASGLKVPGHWPECPNPFRPVAAVGRFSFSNS